MTSEEPNIDKEMPDKGLKSKSDMAQVYYGSIESDMYDLWGSSDTTCATTVSFLSDEPTIIGDQETLCASLFSCLARRRPNWFTFPFQKRRRNNSKSILQLLDGLSSDLKISMLSNFSTAYNVLSISLALHIISNSHPEMTAQDDSLVSSALFGGMILGQLLGGALGDILGRQTAMAVVMFLQVYASFMSSLATEVQGFLPVSLFTVLAFWRFILGLGCGGVYPLAATLTAEASNNSSSSSSGDPDDKAKCVALAFSFQGLGYLSVPIATWIIVTFLDETSELAWRLVLGLGCVPGTALTVSRIYSLAYQSQDNKEVTSDLQKDTARHVSCGRGEQQQQQQETQSSVLESIKEEPDLVMKLLGTAGCWLLFDILFYGNTLFQPVVLSTAFGAEQETVYKAARDTAMISAMALPGYFVSVWMVGRQSPRYIQMQGFLVMALLYACIAHFFTEMASHRYLLLAVYGSTFFFSNYGPNATTFMLPSMTFSRNCRSTLNGFCAACGKVGAMLGSIVFVTASQKFGQTPVFWCCSFLSLAGFAVTFLCVQETNNNVTTDHPTIADDLEQGNKDQLQLEQLVAASEASYMLRPIFSVPSLLSVPDFTTRR